MTKKFDLIIVGGGIMASSLAYNLRKDGYTGSIVVFEKDRMYEYTSTPRSYGGVRHTFSIEGNIRLSQLSIQIYEKFEKEMALDGDPAVIDFNQHGYLYLANDQVLSMLKENMKLQKSFGVNIQLMTPEEVKSFVPELIVSDLEGAVFDVAAGNIDPYSVLQWYVKHAKRLGVEYIYEKVQTILSDGNQQISGVRLESGEEYQASIVVNAAGAWSGELSNTVGLDIPVRPLRKQVYCVDLTIPFKQRIPFIFDTLTGTYFLGEGVKIITGSREGSHMVEKKDFKYEYDFHLDKSYFTNEVWPLLAERSPNFERLKLEQGWAGLYEYNYIDHNAIIGEHPQMKGYYLLTGFSGHGFQQAPAAGKCLSELIRLGKYDTIDLTPFSLERFTKNQLLLEKEVY
ncbi:FAD-binding oxidoreductase [Desulfosporosinus sp.]|uniref:NAD(P)/FAD-dependent oxidoreductase n=1 Tax=Desulfosporosinus sp. TaxID=157907 RepID=UPI000E93D969|nr:FAD-binding oxidoreductase [Desulfosporosinus sp.]MBC2723950.1 FAD-binding oxidoreductase [Desulfosporosinus sp.]MBC2725205.1 FAD-binding oxidoreductase [Desulfosporosinus sp.]HBV88749.1 FAD-dependent oxidoreductase [Desulfosporosinus sp.]